MFDLMNSDNYTSLSFNPSSGSFDRLWVQHADNTFEPVRKSGNIQSKSRTADPAQDWWVTRKPMKWDPTSEGFNVSLNHGPGAEGTTQNTPLPNKGAKTTRQTMDIRTERDGKEKTEMTPLLNYEPPYGEKPDREYAQRVLEHKLRGFKDGMLGLPDPYVTPIEIIGRRFGPFNN